MKIEEFLLQLVEPQRELVLVSQVSAQEGEAINPQLVPQVVAKRAHLPSNHTRQGEQKL